MRGVTLAALLSLAISGNDSCWAAAPQVPLPHGVGALGEPTQVDLGSNILRVQSFVTAMAPEELITFYEGALSRAGWRVGLLPWQSQQTEATRRLEKTLRYTQDTLSNEQREQLKKRLGTFQATAQQMRRELYASYKGEHLIVNIWPLGEAGTAVFLNRWSGDQSWMDGRRAAAGGLSTTNVCCSGEEVPGLNETLPFGLPRYPGAKAVARSGPADSSRATVLLMSPDRVERVADYYRAQMRSSGWRPVGEERVMEAGNGGIKRAQTYQNAGQACIVTIQGDEAEETEAPQTLVTLAVGPNTLKAGSR